MNSLVHTKIKWDRNTRFLIITIVLILVKWIISFPEELTYDENMHFGGGYNWFKNNMNNYRFDTASGMPISAINATPAGIIKMFPNLLGHLDPVQSGRWMTFWPYLGIILIVYSWLKNNNNLLAANISLVLFSVEPNLLAYSQIIGSDVWGAFFAMMTLYFLYFFVKTPSTKKLMGFALAIAFAQIAKQSNIWIYPLSIIYLLTNRKRVSQIAILQWGLVLIIQLFVINLGWRFYGFGSSLKEYHFYNSFFIFLQKIPLLSQMPLPVPKPFLQCLDMVSEINRIGGGDFSDSRCTFASPYIWGELRPFGQFWHYFIIVFIFKTPIPILIAMAVSLFYFKKYYWTTNQMITSFLIFIAIYFSFFYKVQVGIRHIIVVYPLLFICIAPAIAHYWKKERFKPTIVVLLLWAFISNLFFIQDYIPYSNELLIRKKMAYKIWGDSNIYWGQHDQSAIQYAKSQGYQLRPTQIVSGHLLIPSNMLMQENQGNNYRWLYENYEPIDHYKKSFLHFYVPQSDVMALQKKYPKSGYSVQLAKDLYGPLK